ncbi:MAG: efflux RND transporter permease subunit, partial [Terriglobia bacterium]
GGSENQIEVAVDLARMNQAGLTVTELKELLEAKNILLPGGSLESSGKEFVISVSGELNSLEEIEALSLGFSPRQGQVQLSDVATVEVAPEDTDSIYRTGYFKDGKFTAESAVYLFITKRPSADITDISEDVQATLDEVADDKELEEGIETIVSWDDAKSVTRQVGDLTRSGWQGLIIIFFVLFIFVSFRSSLVISAVIPLVLLSVFMIFKILDLSLNTVTLFSLILVLGILVDNAIVIVEAIQYNTNRGYPRGIASVIAINEVGTPVFTATLTTMLVFIPMIFIGGFIGQFIAFIPYTVVAAVAGSFLIAVTITPLLGAWFVRTQEAPTGKIKDYGELKQWRIIEWYGAGMERILHSFPGMMLVLVAAGAMFVASMAIPATGQLKSEQFPAEDGEFFTVNLGFERGTPLAIRDAKIQQIEEELQDINELVNYTITPLESDSSILVTLEDPRNRERDSFEILDSLEAELDKIKDVEIRLVPATAGPPAADYPIVVQINEDDLDRAKNAALHLARHLRGVEGVTDVRDGVTGEEVPQIRVELDDQKLDEQGLVPAAAALQVREVFQPEETTKIRLDGSASAQSTPLELSVQDPFRDNLNDLRDLLIGGPAGVVKLSDIATIEQVEELATINRFNQRRYVQVNANIEDDVSPGDIEKAVKDYMNEDKLDELGLASDALTFRGQFSLDIEALDKIYLLLAIALLLVFIVLVAQFNSFAQPVVIMTAVPLAIIGVFPGLWVTGSILTFLANLGIVALIGIVVNDAIVLVSYSNLLYENGLSRREALVQAGKIRFRPIFSTSLTTIGGILPLTVTLSYWRPIGITIMSGLLFATVGTLVVLPTLFAFASALWARVAGKERDRKEKTGQKKTGRSNKKPGAKSK